MDCNETIQDIEQQPTAQETWELKSALNREHAPKPDMHAEWEKLSERLGLDSEVEKEKKTSTHTTAIISFLTGVAATIAALFLFNLFNNKSGSQEEEYFFTANHEQQEITISSDQGKATVVKEPSLAFKDKAIQPSSAQQKQKMLTLATPRGKDYQLTLADGTKVWMNAESKLEFPETFKGNTREVVLHGEAYFEVAKDAKHPFIVKTDYFQTHVLGTSFNIRAYPKGIANVVLIEGSVSVSGNAKQSAGKEAILRPGQQLSLVNSQMSVKDVDTYPYTQWRDGFFYFENQTLFEIMQELGRWYNVNIAFDDPDKMNVRLHFVASRSQSIADAVRNMNALGVVDVEYHGGAVTIH